MKSTQLQNRSSHNRYISESKTLAPFRSLINDNKGVLTPIKDMVQLVYDAEYFEELHAEYLIWLNRLLIF